jgi:hypothetical protein
MITGYNTDVEHDGIVYHVQTEDKGLETPLLLSLVYSGGAILASKRTSYQDLIDAGFDEPVLAERLQRQHRLICAAINAGRVNELKKMSGPPRASAPAAGVSEPETLSEDTAPLVLSVERNEDLTPSYEPPTVEREVVIPAPPPTAPSLQSAYTVYDSRRRGAPTETKDVQGSLRITLLGERNYKGGDPIELELFIAEVTAQGETPAAATVSVKILGTAFRPVILSLKTNRQGGVSLSTKIPNFKTGRAALVIRATAGGESTETRRVIHPG